MSCNGCRVLRKGCGENCILRPCLQWIQNADAQGHATIFVAKFFGRAGLMSFISAVPEIQRPSLFQSLLYEATGRTVNPVNGAVGLLGSGNWHVCQSAVETVLRGGDLRPIPEFLGGMTTDQDEAAAYSDGSSKGILIKMDDLDLSLTTSSNTSLQELPPEKRCWARTPSMNSDESVCFEGSFGIMGDQGGVEPKLLNLF